MKHFLMVAAIVLGMVSTSFANHGHAVVVERVVVPVVQVRLFNTHNRIREIRVVDRHRDNVRVIERVIDNRRHNVIERVIVRDSHCR